MFIMEHFNLINSIKSMVASVSGKSSTETGIDFALPMITDSVLSHEEPLFQIEQEPLELLPSQKLILPSISIEPIHINEKFAKRIYWDGEKNQCPIEKYLIERVVTRIMINSHDDTSLNQALAISYNENGISPVLL